MNDNLKKIEEVAKALVLGENPAKAVVILDQKKLDKTTFEDFKDQYDKGELKGDKGDQGEQGEKGDTGEQGLMGLQGEKGVDGINGTNGINGRDGKDGVDGKDADIDGLVEEVLSKIPAPEEIVLDDGLAIASKLESLLGDDRLDAKAIKNLDTYIRTSNPNGGGWRNLYQQHDVGISSPTNGQVLKYNSTTKLWYNGNDTAGTPSGSQYDVQLNDGSGNFYGDDSLKWDYNNYILSLGSANNEVIIQGADALSLSDFNGAALYIHGGAGDGAGVGGNVRIAGGVGGVDPGIVSIYDAVNGTDAYLYPDPTGSFTYQFPRKSGTFAMTSDVPAAGANTALSNLASVAINTSLISDTDTTDDLGSTSIRWRAIYGNNGNFIATLTTVTVPAFTGSSGTNWTVGGGTNGWTVPFSSTLDKTADGTATLTPSGTFTITAGVTYKVVITLSARTAGGATYTLGGVVGSTLQAATTYTDYITAATSGKIIISPDNTSRFTISSITVQAMTDNQGDLRVDGNLNVYSTSNFYAPIKMVGTNALAYSTNGSNWFVGGAGGSLNHTAGAFANVGVGVNVLSNSGIGAANCAVGGNALGQGLTGHDNLAFGAYAGWFNTDGFDNCFFGSSAGVVNTSGSRNTWIGREAGGTNATTYYGVAIGYQAAGAFGASGLALGTATSGLVCVGVTSGRDLTSGTYNTMVGYNTGRGVTTGQYNTVIGAQVTGLSTTLTNNIILANGTGAIKAQHDGTNWNLTTNVGIGTSSPKAKLTAIGSYTVGSNIPTTWAGIFAGRTGITSGDNSFYFDIFTSTYTGAEFSTYNYGTATPFPMIFQANGGNIGIGTTATNPANLLSVNGGAAIGASYYGTTAPTDGLIVVGKTGIGVSSPTARLQVRDTTEQMRLDYNATNYFSTTVASTGSTTFDLTASSGTPTFTFSKQVILSNPIRLKGYTVATLPAGTVGDRAYVTDATAPTYLGALTGGGAVVCPVFHNGTIWVSS